MVDSKLNGRIFNFLGVFVVITLCTSKRLVFWLVGYGCCVVKATSLCNPIALLCVWKKWPPILSLESVLRDSFT